MPKKKKETENDKPKKVMKKTVKTQSSKPSRKSPTKTVSTQPSESIDLETNAEKQEEVVKFIDKLIKQNSVIEKNKKEERTKNYANLVALNSEWLDSFFIIGYNLEGEEVVLSKAPTHKDYNSILLLLKKAFVNFFMKTEQ